MGKKNKNNQPPVEEDGIGVLWDNSWGNAAAPAWDNLNDQEEDEDEDEEEEEEYPNRYKQSGRQQQQKGGQQKGNKGTQNKTEQKKNKQNEKGVKNKKGQKQQQQEEVWGSGRGGGGWDGGVNNASEWGQNNDGNHLGPGLPWDDGGEYGESQYSKSTHAGSSTYQQRLLASLLNQPWIPPDAERGRGMSNQGRNAGKAERSTVSIQNPSRTLLYAANGTTSRLDGGARGGPHTTVQIRDSGGAALQEADRALYGRQRPASQRIHWMFSPMKDERVATLMDWIQAMSHALATVGLHKFLQTEKPGALIANADFRPWKAPNEPAFDWVTFDEVVETYDRTLQESMAFYDPETQVLVFVFLLSRSGNSLAMWRRKLSVPNAIRKQNRVEIARIKGNLAENKYVITVDELPPPPPKPKKKWFNVRW